MTIFKTAKSTITPTVVAKNCDITAQKLATDFGVQVKKPSVLAKLRAYQTQGENEKLCLRTLREYLQVLTTWKKRYTPQSPGEEPDPRYTEACRMLECTQYMVDQLTTSPQKERTALVDGMMKENKITLLQEHLQNIKQEDK